MSNFYEPAFMDVYYPYGPSTPDWNKWMTDYLERQRKEKKVNKPDVSLKGRFHLVKSFCNSNSLCYGDDGKIAVFTTQAEAEADATKRALKETHATFHILKVVSQAKAKPAEVEIKSL